MADTHPLFSYRSHSKLLKKQRRGNSASNAASCGVITRHQKLRFLDRMMGLRLLSSASGNRF